MQGRTGAAPPARQPRVSLGMPVYNGAKYLALAIEAILAQTFTDFELIICDNASTDGTQEICERYRDRDARIRYERNARQHGRVVEFQSRLQPRSRALLQTGRARRYLRAGRFSNAASRFSIANRPSSWRIRVRSSSTTTATRSTVSRITLDLREERPHRRFQHFHHVFGEWSVCHPIFGVMRVAPVRDRDILAALHRLRHDLARRALAARQDRRGPRVSLLVCAGTPARRRSRNKTSRSARCGSILLGEQRSASSLTRFRWLYEYLTDVSDAFR